jgi:hypothetical protein
LAELRNLGPHSTDRNSVFDSVPEQVADNFRAPQDFALAPNFVLRLSRVAPYSMRRP